MMLPSVGPGPTCIASPLWDLSDALQVALAGGPGRWGLGSLGICCCSEPHGSTFPGPWSLSGRNVWWRPALWNCGLVSHVCSPCEDPGFLRSPHHTHRRAHAVTHRAHSPMPHTCTHFTHMPAVYSRARAHIKLGKLQVALALLFFQERD